nr:hypothetical protein JVH1_3935 [Rhodococcus sp. JVH1]
MELSSPPMWVRRTVLGRRRTRVVGSAGAHRGVLAPYRRRDCTGWGDLDTDVVELTATRRIRLSLPEVIGQRGSLWREEWQGSSMGCR